MTAPTLKRPAHDAPPRMSRHRDKSGARVVTVDTHANRTEYTQAHSTNPQDHLPTAGVVVYQWEGQALRQLPRRADSVITPGQFALLWNLAGARFSPRPGYRLAGTDGAWSAEKEPTT